LNCQVGIGHHRAIGFGAHAGAFKTGSNLGVCKMD